MKVVQLVREEERDRGDPDCAYRDRRQRLGIMLPRGRNRDLF